MDVCHVPYSVSLAMDVCHVHIVRICVICHKA
jgi:hypothetical protein